MALVVALLACLASCVRSSLTIDTSPDTIATLRDRVNRLEQLVLHQDATNRRLDREKAQLVDSVNSLSASWKRAQKEWERERQTLKDDITGLRDRLDKACVRDDRLLKTSVHDVVARADDINSLEPVVTQISQQLTEVSAEVQVLKASHTADIHSLHNSVNADLQILREASVQQDQAIQEAGSSVYVRWGNSRCPSSTSLVYSGVVGGSLYTARGSATNYLCLTLEPVMSDHTVTGSTARLYGAEYYSDADHGKMHAEDPVCAVCRSTRPAVVMVPGTNRCMAGWTTEYSGFLMAGYHNDPGNFEYVCVDERFEGRLGGHPQQFGALFEFTVAQCGSLPCGPYVDNKVVTCVVCSK